MPVAGAGHVGDYLVGSTVTFMFNTMDVTHALARIDGLPTLQAYAGSNTTQFTGGITFASDFDGVTGLHNVSIVTSAANGYATGSSYTVNFATGTVDTIGVGGVIVGAFSLEAQYLTLTNVVHAVWATPARTVTAGTITTVTGAVGSVASPVGAGTVFDKTGYSLVQGAYDQVVNQIWATAVRTVTAGTITTVSGAVGSVASPVGVGSVFDKTGYTLTQASYDQLTNQVWATPVRSVTAGTVTTVTGSVGSVASPVGASSIFDKTGYALTAAAATAIADSVLDRDMAAGVDSGSASVRTVRQGLRAVRNKVDLLGGVVYKENDSTVSWTFTVASDSSTNRVISVDPA